MKIKKKFSKQILSILLCLAMLMSYVPMTTYAADGDPVAKIGDTEYTTFDDALNNWTDGTTLTLLADVTGLTERIKTYAKGLILDLNGHKIECSDTFCTIWIDGKSGSELTIRDSKGDGYIQGEVYAVTGGSTLRLESGTVESVYANGNFTMTGGKIVCEDDIALCVDNYDVDVVISGGEISGEDGIWVTNADSITVTGNAKITATNGYAIYSGNVNETIIDGTPTLSGTKAEFSTYKGIVFNTLPADDTVWRVVIDTEYNESGIFAVPGEGITLDMGKFASAMDGYEVKQNAKGELLLCNHQTAYEAVSNEDGSTHKILCCCGETTVEASVACSGFGATCQNKAVCSTCGQSYGETNPDAHTFNDDGTCACGAVRGEAINIDLSTLTGTYVISDNGEYIFTGSGSYGIKVESGNPKIVLNNVNISLTDGDYYENNLINGIHIATTGGTTEILVLGESSITAKVGAGIFVAEGGTVKITGSSREDILIATGASGCSGIGGYVYYTNGYVGCVNCGNIEISNVTVKAFGSQSDMGDVAPAIGGAGNANCGYITIDNADVYAEGFISPYGYGGSSAIGTGADFIYYEGGTIGEISIINDSNVYVTRGNYCDYIGCTGYEMEPADGVVNATAKSSTIYCYDSTDTTEPVQTLKYGALGTLLVEDENGNWVCEGEHTLGTTQTCMGYECANCGGWYGEKNDTHDWSNKDGICANGCGLTCDHESYTEGVCNVCGYVCGHENGTATYIPTEDHARHITTYDCCGYEVVEDHSGGDGTATCEHGKVCDKCSEYYGDFIEHHYSYTADDEANTVTVTCDQGCGLNQTVKLSAPENAVYTGKKIEATVTGAAGIDHSLTYNVDPVNAGDYTATLTVGNKSVSVDFTIEKATPTYEVPSGLTATYGDTLADVDLPAGWTWKDEGTTSVGNAGTRTFKALYNPDSDNYNTVEADVTIDVAKADIDFNTFVDPVFATGLVYNGTAQALVATNGSVEGGTIVYSLSPDGEYTTTIPVATEAGTYVVYMMIKGDENHNDYGQPGATYTTVYITDATDPTGEILIKENSWKKFLKWISFGLFCKDNVDVIVTADGTGSAVSKVEYLFSTTALDENNLPSDGWVTVEGDDGAYKFAITAQNKGAVYVKITDAYGNVAVINSDGIVVYTDSNVAMDTAYFTYQSTEDVVVELELNGNTVKNVLFNGHEISGYWSVDGNKLTLDADYLGRLVVLKAGDSYPVTVYFNPLGVETDKVELKDEFGLVINKADGSVTNISDISKTYDGTPVSAPTFEQLGDGAATIEYKVKGADDNTYTTTAPTDAGDYVVRVTVAEGNNHKATSATAEFTIERANIEDAVVTLDKDTFVYNGTNQTPNVTVIFNGVTLTEGVDYKVSYQLPMSWDGEEPDKWFGGPDSSVECINAYDDYYVVVEGIGNYYTADRLTLYAPFVIVKASVTEPTIASKPYTGSAQTADIVDTELYTVEQNNGGTEKGNYDVVLKLKDADNYKWATTDNVEVTLQFLISAAENSWIKAPSINGWTYGEVANAPVYEAKFGTVKVVYTGTANDGSDYNSDTAPTKAGNYTVTFSVEGTEDYTGLSESVDFTIAKAAQAAPAGLEKTDETISKKADGTISGLTSTMEYRKEGETAYTSANISKLDSLEAGKYYVRYASDSNHNASPETEIVIAAGRKLTVTIPQNQVGYTLTVDKTEFDYDDTITINFTFNEGYTWTDDFAVKYNNNQLPLRDNNRVDLSDCTEDIVITVEGVQDTAYPTAEISIKDNKWTEFWNNLTFGLFFNDTQDVTITSADKGSGVNAVYYYLADRELALNEVKAITDWQEYNGTFEIDPDNKYVIYVKVVDNEGNTSYINSDGIVLDATKPAMYGIENGGVYYGDKVFKALDDYLKTLKVDGVDVTAELNGDNEYKIIADNAEHTVTAIDQAGNVTEYKITVYKNYTVTYKVDGETVDTQTVGYGKDATLPEIPKKDGYVGKWDKDGKDITDDTVISVVYTAIAEVIPEQVKPEDKTELEDAKKQLEDMLDDNSYTEDDKKEIQDAIDGIDEALEIIGNVEATEELINKIPESTTKDDEAAIKAADDAYNALTDYEKSLVDEDAKKALDDAKAALAELNKPADPDSPQTGDNSNLWLWFALLFVSGTGIFAITVYDRKRKAASKR